MKKFMIFLLMAFLYLGTCQARSEASHPNDGKLKLLSWVTPTPSESFLTRSDAANTLSGVNTTVYSVAVVGAETGCEGQNIILTAVVDGPVTSTSAPTYQWKLDGDASLLPGVTNALTYQFKPEDIPTLADGLTHEFTVEVSMADCEKAVSPVHPFTMMKFTVELTGPAYICDTNALYDLVATLGSVSGTLPTAYQWYKGTDADHAILFATTTENTISVPGTQVNQAWIVKAVYGTMECIPADTNVFNVPKLEMNNGGITLAPDASTICEGASVAFTATNNYALATTITGFTLDPTPTYEWYINGQLVATTNSTNYSANFDQAGTYTVAVKPVYDNYDCTELTPGTATVTVVAAPALAITGDNVICPGQTTNTITATDWGTGATYTWTVPAGATSSNNTANAIVAGDYTVVAEMPAADGGCEATATFTVYQFGGDLQISATDYHVCPGAVVALNGNYAGWTDTTITYEWTALGAAAGSIVGSATAPTTTVQIPNNASGTLQYAVKATAAGGCSIVDTLYIVVMDTTAATLTVSTPSHDTCVGSQVIAKASVNPGGSYSGLYDWFLNGIQIPGEHADSIVMNMNQPGTYTFSATLANTVCNAAPAPTSSAAVTIYGLEDVTITGNNVICTGDTAKLTATSITGATYAWSIPAGATDPGNTNKINTVVPGTYAVDVTSQYGCVSHAEFNVTQLGADLQLYASEMTVCPGTTVILNANLDGYNNHQVTYEWSDGQHGSTISVSPSDTTTYKVTATADGSNLCQMIDSIKINVLKAGTSPLTAVDVTVPSTDTCVGATIVAEATLTTGLYVTWYLNGVEVPGQNLTTLNLNVFEPGVYQISAKPYDDVCGFDTAKPASKTITVHAAPEVVISGNNQICAGSSSELTATVVPSGATYEYEWIVPAGASSSVTPTATANMPGVYTVLVTNTTSGCVSEAEFTVYQIGADLQVTADKMEMCLGDMVVLNANLDGFDSVVTYEWTGDGLNATTGSTVSAVPTTPGNPIKYVVTATSGACSVIDSVLINVIQGATVATTVTAETTVCQGDQATLKVTSPTSSHYIWYMNGVEIPGENLDSITVNMNEAGTFNFAAKADTTGCVVATVSAPVAVTVIATPVISLVGNNVICNGDTAKVTASVTNSTATYKFRWSNASADNAVLSATTNGIYTVTATLDAAPNCAATASIEVTTFGGDLQLTASDVDICDGQFITLNANLDGMNNENIVYTWTATPAGATLPSASTIVDTPHVNTKYVVTASAGNCEMKDSININVTPVINVTTVLTALDTICAGNQITITATASPAAEQFIWYMNGIEIPGENQPSIVMTMNQAGMYTFAAMAHVDGCNTATVSKNDTLIVLPTPVVTLSGDHYYTTDATTASIVASVYPAGNYDYEWSNGENRSKAEHDTLVVGTPGGYGVYTVTVTSEKGCVVVSEPFTVGSVVDLQAHIVGAHAACQHDVVTLTAVVDYDLEGHTYKWLVNNQYITNAHGIAGATTAHLSFPVDSLYTYYGEVLANEFKVEIYRPGCDSVVTSPVHPFLITPVPDVYVNAPAKICKGDGVTLEAVLSQIGHNAPYQYIWLQKHSGTVTAVDTINYLTTYDVPADQVEGYEYAVTVIFQDIACNTDTSDFVSIPFYKEPGGITISLDPTTICTTNQARLGISDTNAGKPDFGAAYYTWYVNGIEMPLVHGDTLIADFDHNGEYTFWATAAYAEYPCALNYTDTITETVVMHPTVAITGDPIICDGDSIRLYANINDTVGTMTYTYDWRIYNYSLTAGANNITSGSTVIGSDVINYGNTTFNVEAINDPYLRVNNVSAQDFPYVFTLVVTTPEGCQVESDPYFVYVGDSIQVVATVDYDSVCAEGMITATAHLGNWNLNNLTAQWQVSTDHGATWEDISYGTSGILQHVPGVSSIYRIHVVQTTTGCEAYSDTVPVKVFQPVSIHHIVAINHDDNYPTDNVCEGAQLDVTAYLVKLDASGNPIVLKDINGNDSTDANGNLVYDYYIDSTLTYVWELNGMQLQTVHGPSFSAQAYIYDSDPVDYVYTAYIVYDIPGCQMIPVASNTIHVKRNPIVTIEGNHNFCYFGPTYSNVRLTAWVDGDNDPDATYTWYKNGESRPNTDGFDNHYIEHQVPTYDNPYVFTVEVTNGDGCTTISAPHYVNVYELPGVNITGDADSICEGGNVTLRANLDNYNDPMMAFQWFKDQVNETHIIPGATHEIETFEPALGTTNYIVQVTHLMDNIQACVTKDTFQITVNAIPTVTAAFYDLDQTNICEGRSFNIAATVTGGIPGGEVYTWYRNGQVMEGFNGYMINDAPVAIDGEPTKYVYSVSVKQAASGCESVIYTMTDTVTVNPNPVVELVTDPIVCDTNGNNITLLANVEPTPATTVTYNWLENNNVFNTTTANTISFHKDYRDYPYSFSVELVNAYGCVAEASALVYVNAEPVVNITATETEICNGGEITLTASLNDWNADQLTFQWYDGTTLIPGATSLSYTVVPTQGTHKYTIQIDQLTSLCHATSDTVTVTVNADPTVTITYAAAQYTVCDGYQVDLTTTVTGGVTGGEVYTWYRNGQVIEGATAATYSEVVSALNGEPTTYNYAVSVAQTAAGCESNVYDQLATITVNPNPVVVLTTDPIVCDTNGNNITLTANLDPANIGSNVTYKWMEDNHLLAGFTTPTTSNTISFHKDYRDYPYSFAVEVVNDYACTATSEALVYVNAEPIVNTTVTENNICVGGEITMTANLDNWNADQLTFQWYDNNVAIPGATSLSYTVVPETAALTAPVTHQYYVKIFQLTSECEATSTPFTVTVNPDPVIATVVASQTNVCNGAQLTITATPTDGNVAGEVYTWYRNGILMPNATAATIQDTPGTIDNNIQQYTYTAVVTRPQAGCTSLPVASQTVTVYPNPVVVITGDQHVCETDSIFLIANVDTTAFPVGNLHYTWYESGQIRDNMAYGLGDNSFYAEYFYARTEPYVFTVNVERNDIEAGCASMSAEFYVYVYPQPVVNITTDADSICEGGEVTLFANLNDYNAENLTVQWYEIRYHDVHYNFYYNDNDQYVDTVVTEAYKYLIPGATMPVYHTTLNNTTTLGVIVYQTNSTCWASDEVEIIVKPTPVITGVTVSNDTVCEGTQVTITATTNFNDMPAGNAVYTWYRNGEVIEGVNGASFSENVFTTDDHITVNTYTAVVTLPISGCVSAVSPAATVTVLPAPTTVSISGNNVICEGDSTTLTVYSNVPGNITWNTGSHDASITVPAGTYTVTVETLGCQMTSEPFTVQAFGTDLLVSASATSICRGEHTTLYVDQEGWQGNVTYAWDSQAGNSTATTVDVQPDSTTTYHVTATVSSTNGSCTAEGEVTIIVHQLPAAFQVTASTNTICEGQQITFTAPNDPQVTGYIWYQNGVEIPGENQATLTVNFNEAGDYTFAAKAISVEGCISAEASAPVTVTVKPAPSTVTITGINILCENDSTTLTAHSDVPGMFTWNDGTTGATIVVNAGVYNVTLTTPEGCSMTSENFTVEAFGTDLLVSASATAICEGEHTTLYVNQDGWQGNVTYQWDAQAGNSTASTVDVQPDTTTTYHVTATVSSTNGSCTAEGEVTIVVTPRPAQVVVNASVDTICQGQQITFNASGNAYAYIWYQNGVEIPGENQATLTVNFNEAGNYTFAAKAINDQNCESAEASLPVTVTVNPAPTTVTITGVNILCENSTTTLTAHSDVAGTFTWNDGTTGATKVVPAGVYNVTLTTPEGCSMTSENFTVEAFGTDVLVSASATAICQGEHTTLYVNQDGWQGNVTYQWDAQAGNSTASTVDVQPANTTTYHVTATVSSTNGSCTAEGEVTIIVNPLPVVAAVTATDTVVCEGTQVTFHATGDANTTAYIWYHNGVEIAGENQADLTINFNEQGVYNYAVKAISNEGCVSAVAINAPAVTVNAAPQSVTISGNVAICDGGSTTLYANVVPNDPALYTWYKDNVVINTNTQSIVVSTAGSYKVEASFNGCVTVSEPVVVTVEQTPQLQLTATESVICAGGSTVITAEATGWNNENVNYNWSNNFEGSSFTFNSVYAGTYTFTVTASQATSGCEAVDQITITVNALPATPQVTVDNAVICEGGQVTLQVTNPNNNATYTWMRNGVVIPGANGATLTESPVAVDGDATNYVYTVIATLPMSGCTSLVSSNTVVTVTPTPVAYVSVEGNTTVCAGGSTTLHANVTPAAAYTYQWYKDNVLIPGATTADYVAAEVARETAYLYTVVVTANPGCNVTAAAPAITFVADPVVVASISNNISCVGGTATLTVTVDGGVANVNGLNGYTFEWYKNNSSTLVGTNATYTTSAADAAGNYTYWVTVTSNYGCQSTSNVVNYSVVADPTVTIAVANGYPTTVCNGGATMLKANVTGGYGDISYQWYKNNNLLVGQTNQTLALNGLENGVNDVYMVEVTQTGVGCANSASAAINTLVNVAPNYTVNITGFGNVCEGGTLTLTANVNNVLTGDVLSYQWYKIVNGADAVAINGANAAQYSTSDLLMGNTYDYYVVVTSTISGCSVVSTSVPANVVSAPTVAIQGANTVCEGGNLTLNAFVTGGVDGAAYTYTWTWTGAANGTATTAVPTFNPTLPANDLATPYYFTVTISRNDNTGCTATSAAHEVNVLAIPTVSVTADNNYICQNGEVTFTAHVSPVGAYNYVWTINGQQQAVNAATVTTTMATTGTINASVVVAAANASASCSATATIAAPVQVVAVPTVTLAANHTTMCVGGVTTLTATVNANANIPGNFNYEWIVDGAPLAGVTNTLNQTLNTAGVHTYQVRVSQNNNLGCASDWSNQATVQVAEQPVVTLSSEDGLAICEGGSITLTGVVTNYGNTVNGVTNSAIYGNLTFDWTSNGVNVHHNANINNAMNQVTETLNNVGNYTYQVAVTPNGYNCQPQISNEYTVNVVGNPSWTDVHVYSNNGTDACLGEMVTLMAGIQGGVSDYANSTNGHIQWVVTDGNGNTVDVSGGLGGFSYDIPAVAGTYIYTPTFVGNIGNGCQLTNTNAVQVAVTVHDLPTAEFTSGDGTELCANDISASAALVISFTGVAPFTYEVVDDAGNIIAHATTMANTATIYVAPDHQTTYRINLISDNYCENPAVGDATVATVYVNEVEFETNFFVSGCSDNGNVTIYFNMISGDPNAAFSVVYDNGLQASGVISNNTATFAAPSAPGDYNAVFTVDGCSYDIVVRVLVGEFGFGGTLPIMDQRWNDVVVVNNNPATNGGHNFVSFQWYHNGVAIPGAIYSNYQDKAGLDGFYSVELIEKDANGNMVTYMTCEMYFNGSSSVKVYPVPANVRQEITIELELTSEELEGAVLDIYSVTGAHISHVTDLQPITKIEGFKAQGTYFGRILTGTNEIKTVKFIIVK